MLFPRNIVDKLVTTEMRRAPLSHWRLPAGSDQTEEPVASTPTAPTFPRFPTFPTFPINPAVFPDPSAQLDEIAEQLRDITDFQSLAELAQLEPPGAMWSDPAADIAVRTMEQAWQRLLSAINLEELMPPPQAASGLELSPGLAFAASACADAVDAAADELRRCRQQTFGTESTFSLPPRPRPSVPVMPAGVRLIELITTHSATTPCKQPTLCALRREHPGIRLTNRLFDHAWVIAASAAHRLALLALWRSTSEPVAAGAEWTALDEIEGVTADAMRALRDWQAARRAGLAPEPRHAMPALHDLRPYGPGLATEILSTIREFVYLPGDGRNTGIRAFEAWLARQPLLAAGPD